MVKVTNTSGLTTYLPPGIIERIVEADNSSKCHGIYAYIHTTTGKIVECRETVDQIRVAYDQESAS